MNENVCFMRIQDALPSPSQTPAHPHQKTWEVICKTGHPQGDGNPVNSSGLSAWTSALTAHLYGSSICRGDLGFVLENIMEALSS